MARSPRSGGERKRPDRKAVHPRPRPVTGRQEPAGDTSSATILRVLDANVNRCAEGLRVIEEIARFSLVDAPLVERLKEMRHAVRRLVAELSAVSLRHRDSAGDVGRDLTTRSEGDRRSLAEVARANFARAEEALRVMEEFGKLIDAGKARRFKSLRFELYTIERTYFIGSRGNVSMPRSPFLYAILDRGIVSRGEVARVAACLVEGGADIIQYRAKECTGAEKRLDLVAVLAAAIERSIPVIVNDDCELACEMGADGVHVGALDCPPAEARAMLGPGRIIGVSVHSLAELERVPLEAVDYIAVGAIYPSPTKPGADVVGLEFLRRVRSRVALPIVAIGGIGPSNVGEVLGAGADGAAIVSAILSGDVRKNCFTVRQIIDTRLKR
jgi:thiamine-phosphate pyrophosphorylase